MHPSNFNGSKYTGQPHTPGVTNHTGSMSAPGTRSVSDVPCTIQAQVDGVILVTPIDIIERPAPLAVGDRVVITMPGTTARLGEYQGEGERGPSVALDGYGVSEFREDTLIERDKDDESAQSDDPDQILQEVKKAVQDAQNASVLSRYLAVTGLSYDAVLHLEPDPYRPAYTAYIDPAAVPTDRGVQFVGAVSSLPVRAKIRDEAEMVDTFRIEQLRAAENEPKRVYQIAFDLATLETHEWTNDK